MDAALHGAEMPLQAKAIWFHVRQVLEYDEIGRHWTTTHHKCAAYQLQ